MPQSIYGSKAAYRLRTWIENGGIFDTVVIGNSRVAFGGYGVIWGAQYALGQILPQYSTGMCTFGQNDQTSGLFQNASWLNPYGWNQAAPGTGANEWRNAANVGNPYAAAATTAWARRMSCGQNVTGTLYYYNTNYPFYYAHGSAIAAAKDNGIYVPSAAAFTNSLDADEAMRARFYHCSEVPGGSSYEPGIDVYNGSAFSNAATCGVQTIAAAATVAGTIVEAMCTLAAASRGSAGAGIKACWSRLAASGRALPTGPLLLGELRVSSDDRPNGWAVHRWINLGGNGTRDMANQFNYAAPTAGTRTTYGIYNDTIDYQIKVWTAEQLRRNQRPRLRIVFNECQNSRNTTAASMMGIADGDSTDALIDNTSYIIAAFLGRWCQTVGTMTNGTIVHYGEDDICIEVHTEQVQSDPNDGELDAFAEALATAMPARFPRSVFVVDDRVLIPYAELVSNSYFDGGGNAHLVQTGEQAMQVRTLAAVRSTGSPDATPLRNRQ